MVKFVIKTNIQTKNFSCFILKTPHFLIREGIFFLLDRKHSVVVSRYSQSLFLDVLKYSPQVCDAKFLGFNIILKVFSLLRRAPHIKT